MNNPPRRALFYLITLMIVATFTEIASYAFGQYFLLRSPGSFLLFDPKTSVQPSELDEYYARRDPVLGWPPRDLFGGDRFDGSGARPSPKFPETQKARVSIYGGSFTYGSEVDHEHAWGEVLSGLLGNRVANYGVPGYGPDQAYLRFKSNVHDTAQTVILAFIGDNIIRIVNQDRRLVNDQYGGMKLKPRYVLSDTGTLQLLLIPSITRERAPDYLRYPERYLEQEWFLPSVGDGGVRFEFPFTASIVSALSTKRAVAFYMRQPSWLEYFDETHESLALPLLVTIIQEFDRSARERGKRFLFVMLPSAKHLMYQLEMRTSPVKSLMSHLQTRRVDAVDLTLNVLEAVGDEDGCEIFTKQLIWSGCWGHYNNRGNAIVASLVADLLAN